jgi:type IV secretory pathway VirB10-like protein
MSSANGAESVAGEGVRAVLNESDGKAEASEAAEEREADGEQEGQGGGRLSRRLLVVAGAVAVMVGVSVVLGIRSAGVTAQKALAPRGDEEAGQAARDQAEVDELKARAAPAEAPPVVTAAAAMPMVKTQESVQHSSRAPSRYAQWAEDKYMKALEAPEMVAAFHGGGTLEIARAQSGEGGTGLNAGTSDSNDPSVTLRPPASPFTVMAGSVIPAVLVSGINSDLPGPILAQVSENVFDSRTGRSLLIPQGSRLIGAYENASAYGQQRVRIAWRRLIFPDTSSMDLPQMPGADQGGYAGFSDEVNNHYLSTFGTAALMSLISAGQMVGQLATFGGGGAVGPYGYYQPNQWAMASEMAGAGASAQMGAAGQQMIGNGMNRPPTLEIRPGYQFNVMVTQDLAFPGPYKE